MQWTIPGTTLVGDRENADRIEGLFQSLFLAGGLTLRQVSSVTGLEPYMVQNWVKRGFLTKPQQKRYTLRQLCRIININMLKSALPMESICSLLTYVNGHLDDESDDLIDDSALYFMFGHLAAQAGRINSVEERNALIAQAMETYQEPVPGAKERVEKVLRIMLTAWASARLRQDAEQMLRDLNISY